MRKLPIILVLCMLASCSLPFGGKKTEQTPPKTETGTKVETALPKPGDIKIVEGVEYIYAKNRRYMIAPYEPEYIWIRKDQYSPGLYDTVVGSFSNSADKKQQQELEQRLAKLEENIKKGNATAQNPQVAYVGPGSLPGVPYISAAVPTFNYPSPKMKRRVVVLNLDDRSNYKEERLGDLATSRLISRLQSSGAIVCVDPHTVDMAGDLTKPEAMKVLNEVYGVQAVIKGSLSDVYISTSKMEGTAGAEVSQAMATISIGVYDTETGRILRQLNGRNPVFLTRETGEMSSEKVKVRAIDLAIELVSDDVLKTILDLDWHARIASVEGDKVFIDAGRLSGLQQGDVLQVYAPGEQIIDKTTKQSLGRTKGDFKGELKVSELFGVDAAWAVSKKPVSFAPTDLVYLKK